MSQDTPRRPRVPGRVGKSSQRPSGAAAGKGQRHKSSATAKSAGSNAIVKWGIRGIVGGLLIGFVIVAALDFVRKGHATKTGNAWTEAFDRGVTSGEPLKFSKLEPLIVGSPVLTDRPVPADASVDATKIYRYTWRGIFRKYVIDLYVQEVAGGEATVSKIDPGGGK